jgi:hypothetical protein
MSGLDHLEAMDHASLKAVLAQGDRSSEREALIRKDDPAAVPDFLLRWHDSDERPLAFLDIVAAIPYETCARIQLTHRVGADSLCPRQAAEPSHGTSSDWSGRPHRPRGSAMRRVACSTVCRDRLDRDRSRSAQHLICAEG